MCTRVSGAVMAQAASMETQQSLVELGRALERKERQDKAKARQQKQRKKQVNEAFDFVRRLPLRRGSEAITHTHLRVLRDHARSLERANRALTREIASMKSSAAVDAEQIDNLLDTRDALEKHVNALQKRQWSRRAPITTMWSVLAVVTSVLWCGMWTSLETK